MRLHLFDPQSVQPFAYAVYSAGKPVFRNRVHCAYFSAQYMPPIPVEDRRVYRLEEPIPHLAARNAILLDGEEYTLFILLPLSPGDNTHPVINEDDVAIRPVRDLFSLLIEYTTPQCTTPSVAATGVLFSECCAQLGSLIAREDEAAVARAIHCTTRTRLDRDGMMLTLCAALPYLAPHGRIIPLFEEREDGQCAFTFLSGGGIHNRFLRRFLAAIADGCGFDLQFLPNGLRFLMKPCTATTLVLAHPVYFDPTYFIQLGELLFDAS